MNNGTFYSLTENEEHDIPKQILKTIFGLHASVIFRPQYVWFLTHLQGLVIPNSSGHSTRVDMYSHQILLRRILGIKFPKEYRIYNFMKRQ